MKKAAYLGLLCISVCPVCSAKTISQVGDWTLDTAQSDFGPSSDVKSAKLNVSSDTFKLYSYKVQIIDKEGKRFVVSWSGPEDGSSHPVSVDGKTSDQSASFKRMSDGTIIRRGVTGDGSDLEVKITMSADGNTLTDVFVSTAKDGKKSTHTEVWRRATTTSDASKKPAP